MSNDSNTANVRLWNKRNYAAINEELERINWESMFEGDTIDQWYGTFLSETDILVELYIPLTTRQEEVVSGCNSCPPKALMKCRSDAWKKFVKARTHYGRNS